MDDLVGRLIQIAWCFAAAGFLGFVWVCVLLTRWHKREERNQAATEKVLDDTEPSNSDLLQALRELVGR